MAFALSRVEPIGRLGADVTVNHHTTGVRVANLTSTPCCRMVVSVCPLDTHTL